MSIFYKFMTLNRLLIVMDLSTKKLTKLKIIFLTHFTDIIKSPEIY